MPGLRGGTAAVMSDRCRTRYPILLLHGMNCRDDWPVPYWGRIPEALRAEGALVFLGGQDAWGSVEGNAAQLRGTLLRLLEETGAEKVNLIAHSKGGLEARYLLSAMGMGDRAASLTTVCTPHHGSRTADWFLRHKILMAILSAGIGRFWRWIGDQRPCPMEVAADLSTAGAAAFNAAYPDVPGVLYQSWGACLTGTGEDRMMQVLGWLTHFADGRTDGLVRPDSARWTHYRGTVAGVSHQDMTDTRQRSLRAFNPVEFYLRLVEELKAAGC